MTNICLKTLDSSERAVIERSEARVSSRQKCLRAVGKVYEGFGVRSTKYGTSTCSPRLPGTIGSTRSTSTVVLEYYTTFIFQCYSTRIQ
jgi:hypothetical protein